MQTAILGNYLLPNLRTIRWGYHSWDLLPFLRLFLNPELTEVGVRFPTSDPHVYRPAVISLIPTKDLTHLRLGFMWDHDPLYLDALCNLLDQASKSLRTVRLLGELSMSVVEKLIQLPNLRHLEVHMPGSRISPPAVVFPSLETLSISYAKGSTWLHTLRNIPDPALRRLNVIYWGSSQEYLQTLGTSLIDANLHQILTSVECGYMEAIPLTGAGLHPFLSFGGLTKLKLPSSCGRERCTFQLDDATISKLAVALPRLTYLGLGSTPCNSPPSGVTIRSLVTLSANCVNLDFLRLHFDAKTTIPRDTNTYSQAQRVTCKLRTLDVGFLPLSSDHDDILLVTFTILQIFPHLETISAVSHDWDPVRRVTQLWASEPVPSQPHPD